MLLPSKTAIFEKRAPVVAEFCHLPAIRLPGCVFTGVMSKQAQKKQKREAHRAGGKYNEYQHERTHNGSDGYGKRRL